MSEHAKDQAIAQVQSICEMVASLNCDYARLEELRDELEALADSSNEANSAHEDALKIGPTESADTWRELCEANVALADWREANGVELAQLKSDAGDCEDEDEARTRIHEDALSVEVRSGWVSSKDEFEPEEFRIVLCTGGPHVELVGDLSNCQPSRVRVLYRDWGDSGEYFPDSSEREAIETYCNVFYFGE